MYCPNCGTQVPDGQKFCGSCGSPMTVPPPTLAETPPAPAAPAAPLPPPLPVGVRKRGKAGIVIAGLLVGLVLILIAAYVLLRSFAPSVLGRIPVLSQWQPCYIQSTDYLKQMEAIGKEWDDANALASSAPRISLAQPLSVLQDIRRRADSLSKPECAGRVHTLMVDYMDAQIGGYMAFMSQEPDAAVQAKFQRSQSIYELWADEMAKMAAGESPYDQSASAGLAPVPEPPEPTALPTLTPTPALIVSAAKDMNLDVGEVGAGYTLSEEQGLEEIASSLDISYTEEVRDASYRTFQNKSGSVALSLVIILKDAATTDSLKELTGGFEKGLTESMQGTTLENFSTPTIGDESSAREATFPDLGLSLYFLGFRKLNVIGVLALVGTSDSASQEIIVQLAQKLENKVR